MTGFLKVIHLKPLLFLFFLFTISSCSKDLNPEDFQLHFETSFPLKDILFNTDNAWLACGGEVFESGYLVDGGSIENPSIELDTLGNKCLNSLHLFDETNSSTLFATGVYTFGMNTSEGWTVSGIDDLFILRDAIQHDESYFIIGGAGLSTGVLYSYERDDDSSNFEKRFSLTFDNDLYFIEKIDDQIFTGGFGLLMHTEEVLGSSTSWNILDKYEDHWIDIDYREDVGILVLGASGRIIRSKDKGQSWQEVSSPSFSGVSDFKDLLIYKDKIYLACGENICVSGIENIEWERMVLESSGEINRLAGNNDRIFFVTNSGKVASIAH